MQDKHNKKAKETNIGSAKSKNKTEPIRKSRKIAPKTSEKSMTGAAKTEKTQTKTQKHAMRASKNNSEKSQNVAPKRDNMNPAAHNIRRQKPHSAFRKFAAALAFIALGAAIFLMLFTFTDQDLSESAEAARNLFGFPGAKIADIMLMLFGIGAFHFSFVCLVIGICISGGKQYDVKATEIIGLCLLILGTVPILALGFGGQTVLDHAPGGVIGQRLLSLMTPHAPGFAIVSACAVIVLFGFLLVTDIRLKAFVLGVWRACAVCVSTLARVFASPFKADPNENEGDAPISDAEDRQEYEFHAQSDRAGDDAQSLFYEDTPSQLLDNIPCDLDDRVARANMRDNLRCGDPSDFDDCNAEGGDIAPRIRPETPDSDDIFDNPPNADIVSAQNRADAQDANGKQSEETCGRIEFPCACATAHGGETQSQAPKLQSLCNGACDAALQDLFGDEVIAADVAPAQTAAPKLQPENAEQSSESLGDIMARIKKSAPKSRSIRRSRSVPALEPDFEFDSILSPEQLEQSKRRADFLRPKTGASNDVSPRASVLQNWKPRAIDRRPISSKANEHKNNVRNGCCGDNNNIIRQNAGDNSYNNNCDNNNNNDGGNTAAVMPTDVLLQTAANRETAVSPVSNIPGIMPQNVTRDILAQLETADFDIGAHAMADNSASENHKQTGKSANSAVTRMAIAPIDPNAAPADPFGDTAQAVAPAPAVSVPSLANRSENGGAPAGLTGNFALNDPGFFPESSPVTDSAAPISDADVSLSDQFRSEEFSIRGNRCEFGFPSDETSAPVTFRRRNIFDEVNRKKSAPDDANGKRAAFADPNADAEHSEQWRALMADANPDFSFNRNNPVRRNPVLRAIAPEQKTRIPTIIPSDNGTDVRDNPNAQVPARSDASEIRTDNFAMENDNAENGDPKRPIGQNAAKSPDSGNDNAGIAEFSVAEEKKRPSAQELDNADKARRLENSRTDYTLPPLSILRYEQNAQKGFEMDALRSYAKRIKEKLEEYKVFGDVINICPGPVVTRFEYLPAPGTKAAKVEGLSKDLMMALEIMSIRILAPIPGKNVIGIEIPNERRNTIYFKEIVGSDAFRNAKSLLTIALGKDSEGEPVVSDLAKMPHLLVAGTTGSGKSVGINTMLCSLLYNASPDEVKLILVDPKMLELSIYAGIPHLLVPPITTPGETAAALEWACGEMDDRYRKLASFGVRNIAGYNQQLKTPSLPSALECVKQTDENGDPIYKPMPYIVIVVDEFADLMMVAGKEIEKSIARLAQKARAAGIHIILATQRPSTNIITGVIKANFPTRLAFKVMTLTDSRVILDQRGAETLLGNGDSLFLAPTGALTRVHGAFVSDDEVQAVVSFLSAQRRPEYNYDITAPKDDGEEQPSAPQNAFDKDKLDGLFADAVDVVRDAGQASASLLQRRLGIGFNRSARLIEQMERQGIVGPARGQKPREVLI